MRSTIKKIAERALTLPPVLAAARRSRRDETLVLAYHNIIPDDAPRGGDRSLHLTRAQFAEQLDVLTRSCDVVSLAELDATRRTPRRRARVVITFDDAYAGALSLGLDEVTARGLPATVFTAPALLGRADCWWDAAAGIDDLEPAVREAALGECAGRDERVREWLIAHGQPLAPAHPARRIGTERELLEASRRAGITIASHTWSHPNLAALDERALREELQRSHAWLSERVQGYLPWLSYPYGLSTPVVQEAARACGYIGACLVEGGWASPPLSSAHAIPRLNVPAGLSTRGFSARTAGLLTD